ncbi:hypothetical protein CSKR_113263 [Clonorchis sinensis]|uniref:Uncharacterized protein n=1 Tax=Clonorchis sinensis TaxID=79923 RepID=A0A3R7H499_CLOSI|nr:hypothetical protein CSKR_113263 [Clonorchis sinensis]
MSSPSLGVQPTEEGTGLAFCSSPNQGEFGVLRFGFLAVEMSGSSGQSASLLSGRSVAGTRPLPLDFPCLDLGNLAVFQPSYFFRVAWQLGTERVLQLNDERTETPDGHRREVNASNTHF